jgi:hypothetical protein
VPDDGWPGADDPGSASADPWAAATRAARPPVRPAASGTGSGAPAAPRKPVAKPAHDTPAQKKMAKKAVKPAVRPPAGANDPGAVGSADPVDPIDSMGGSTATHHAPDHEQKQDAGGSGPQDASGPGNDA